MSQYEDPYNRSRYGSDSEHARRSLQPSDYRSYSRESGSTYDRYRRQARERDAREMRSQDSYQAQEQHTYQAREHTQSAQSSYSRRGGAQSQQQGTYSRYNSGVRYAEAARRRNASKSSVGAQNNRRVKKAAPKRSLGISLSSFGGRSGSKKSRSGFSGGGFSRPRVNLSAVRGPIIGIVAGALTLIVIVLLWSNRSIEITFNGETAKVRNGSTIDQIIEQASYEATPGNLISVSGKKLEDGQGYPYLFKLNDEEQDGEATNTYRARGGDVVTIENGRDRTEDYDVVEQEEMPKLEVGGDAWGNITYVSQWPVKGKYEMRTGKISGETARGDTLTETKNCIVSVHQISPDDNKKLVCLTFDDGPAEGYTEKYLEILNTYGIKATFFNLGQQVEAYPELAKKIVEQGSEIMSHTYQHQQLSTLDAASLQSEFSNAFEDIETNVGVSTTSFRPPYGDFNQNCWLNSGGLASVSVLWNMDSEDWRRAGVDSIVEKSTSGIFSGAIILMHDGGGERSQDVEALPKIIEKLQSQGYEFVTVSELMKSDSSIPEDIASGNATMPEGCTWPTEIAGSESQDSSNS